MKKIKICFDANEYNFKKINDIVLIILDYKECHFSIKFCIDHPHIKYGKVVCLNSGVEYDSFYRERTFYKIDLLRKYSFLNKINYRLFDVFKYIAKVPSNV